MLCLFFFGKRVNGALSWFSIASFNLQPSEFVKITVALAVSKYISDFQTDLKNTIDQFGFSNHFNANSYYNFSERHG